jgi:hypothetical protein
MRTRTPPKNNNNDIDDKEVYKNMREKPISLEGKP